MCGRFYLDADFDEIIKKYGLYHFDDAFLDGTGIHRETLPSENGLLVRYDRQEKMMKSEFLPFGIRMKRGTTNQLLLNGRAETLYEKPTFSSLMSSGRCIIPATSFPEWLVEDKKKTRVDFVNRSGLMSLAGLYTQMPSAIGDSGASGGFIIITQPARGQVAEIHDRMPVALGDSQLNDWLSGELNEARLQEMIGESLDFEWIEEPNRQLKFF